MSTKRLARTVIEGGRSHYNTYARRRTHRVQRHREREYLRALERDPGLAESVPPPVRRPVRKWHYDRLSAAERWLADRAGRPWREVEGEILATFDTRSIAGRHVVYDHLLPSPWWQPADGSWRVSRRYVFRVDEHGNLVAEAYQRGFHPYRWRCWVEDLDLGRVSSEAAAFVGDDRIGLRDHHAYWLHLATARFHEIERRRTRAREPRFTQGRELTEAERARYDALSAADRIAITLTLDGSDPR